MHMGVPLPPDPMEELERNKKIAEQKLSGKEMYELKKKQKEQEKKGEKRKEKKEKRKEQFSAAPKKTSRYLVYAIIGIGVVGGLGWFIATRSGGLPPTSMQGHIEQSPPSHIMDTPMPENIQRHMLEHADGNDGGGGGIIIQYNCDQFECESDLIEKLTNIAELYPKTVYLAPNTYDGKVILTKLGKRKVLDEFNEEAILKFIR